MLASVSFRCCLLMFSFGFGTLLNSKLSFRDDFDENFAFGERIMSVSDILEILSGTLADDFKVG